MHDRGPIVHGDIKGVGVFVLGQKFDSTTIMNDRVMFWSPIMGVRCSQTSASPTLPEHP